MKIMKHIEKAAVGLTIGALAATSLVNKNQETSLEEQLLMISAPYSIVAEPQGTYLHVASVTKPEQLEETIKGVESACLNTDGSYSCGVITRFNKAPEVEAPTPQANSYVEVFVDSTSCDQNRIASRLGTAGYDIEKIITFDGGEKHVGAANTYHFSEEDAQRLQTEFRDEIIEAGRAYNINPLHIATLINNESTFKEGQVSSSGAKGLMQIKPSTAEPYGFSAEDLDNPAKNIMAGTAYLADALERFGDIDRAIGAYHDGINGVQRDVNAHGCEAVYENLSKDGRRHVRKFNEVSAGTSHRANITTKDYSDVYRDAIPRMNIE